ncbi:hypothetical protein SteCoe_14244 [Stentor coeruleus]|uniref:RCC1-like domain-containing protein n=1 Tax=Stentor coeruleus TaxID=5963 RepID=A0A1R2C6B9_9CILI|nr:hypothetical protein SteCoe_14244 [Stentor coeruleus]
MYCSKLTKGILSTHDYFNGKTVECIGGGFHKLYILEPSGKVTVISADPTITEEYTAIEQLGHIKSVTCGKYHTLVLNKDGFLYSFGSGIFGVLGHGGALSTDSPQLIKTISDKVIKEIACGEAHSLALTQHGEVYAWGRGYEGQLGIRNSVEASSVPKYIDSFYSKHIKTVACGQRSSFAIELDGKIYSWGEGRCGQLGHGMERVCRRPKMIEFSSDVRISEISAGAAHAVALTEKGQIWAWGMNNYGQLGIGNKTSIWIPELVEIDSLGNQLQTIVKVTCSAYSSFCISSQGSAYSWGKGFIGHGTNSIEERPKIIYLNTENRSYSDVFSCDHSTVLFSPLRLYSLSPICGPVTGGTKISMIGTALAFTDKLKVRFRYAHFMQEADCNYDANSNSLEFFSPSFADAEEDLTLPVEAFIDVTMDGEHYVTCEKTFMIYPDDLFPESLNPKCASVHGKCSLEISVDFRRITDYVTNPKALQSWFWNLIVGFLPKPRSYMNRSETPTKLKKEGSLDESRLTSVNDVRNEDHDWLMTAAKFIDGKIICTIPTPEEMDENNTGYVVDFAINGQQFSGKPLNFKFYNIEINELKPVTGFSDAGTNIRITGKGFYDSTAKKLRITSQYGERDVAVNWDRKTKSYQCVIPPLHWLVGSEGSENIKDVKKVPLKLDLTLNCIEYTTLPAFCYNDIKLLRISKAKIDETLTPQAKQELWEKEEHEEKEENEAKIKREQEEDLAMQTACKPGVKLYLWSEGLIKTSDITVRFILGNQAIPVIGIYKNAKKIGVIVPELGDIIQPTEVLIDLSLNAQSFTKEQLPIKYLGANAVEEQPKRRK